MSQAGEGWNPSVEQCCSCCARSDERQQIEETVRSVPLHGLQLCANLPCVPQIVELAGKLCVAAADAN